MEILFPLTADELCPSYMNYHTKTEAHNNSGVLRDCQKRWNYYADFFFFSFPLSFLNNTLREKWYVFQLRTKSRDNGSFPPLAHADQLVVQTQGKVSKHHKPNLRFPSVSEPPRWKNRRKQILSNSHLCIFFFFPQIIGGYRIKQGKKQQLPTQLRGYMSFCQKARPWKCYIIILKTRYSPLLTELHRATEIWNVVIHTQKMHVDLQKILFSTFGALPTWKQILFVLRTLETAFLVLEVYIISFSWYTATLCSPPCT